MSAGLGEGILEFLCKAKWNREDNEKIRNDDLHYPMAVVPGTHIFVYSLHRPKGINLPSETFGTCGVDQKTKEDLYTKIKSAFNDIADKIEGAMEKRGAVLTRGLLSNQFVI